MKKILIVDDDPVSVALLSKTLHQENFEIISAPNGEVALTLLKNQSADLILLDVEMPEMNGYTFMMEKTKRDDIKDIPVIVLTAHNEVEPIFRRHNIKSYLLKPVNITELIKQVRGILS